MLPVPDVEGTPTQVVATPPPDHSRETRKWLIATSIAVGVMASLGLIVFVVYVLITNSPGYMLGAAMQNLATTNGEAGTLRYQPAKSTSPIPGDFVLYPGPADPNTAAFTLSLGQGASRVSGALRLFDDTTYVQTGGLGNTGRLLTVFGHSEASLTPDSLLRLSSLDSQWYAFGQEESNSLQDLFPAFVRGNIRPEHLKTIGQIYLRHPFVTAAQQVGNEDIGGTATMRIRVGLDQAKLGAFWQELKDARIPWLALSNDDIGTLQKRLELDKFTLEVWIARSDRTFRQAQLSRSAADTLTVTLQSELAAAERQNIVRPQSAKSATVLARGLHDIFSSANPKPAAQ